MNRPTDGPSEKTVTAEGFLARFSADSPPASAAEAAVLIVLREDGPEVETLLLERSHRPTDPASGEVSLPGGHVHPSDRSLRETALREFEEEVGLPSNDLTGPARFVSIEDAPRFGIRVGVFAALLDGGQTHDPAPSPAEVAQLFWLPRKHLRTLSRLSRQTPTGPREVDAVVYEEHVVWGFTLRVLRQFFT